MSAVRTKPTKPAGWQVFHWEEFLAFAQRLGIDLELPTRRVTIILDVDAPVSIEQEYIGRDMADET